MSRRLALWLLLPFLALSAAMWAWLLLLLLRG